MDFHAEFLPAIRAALNQVLPEHFVARIEEYGKRRQRFLTVRKRQTQQVVTVIELLSPANKRANSSDLAAYLEKREEIRRSPAHLVELDLLRGGEPLPTGDYYGFLPAPSTGPVWKSTPGLSTNLCPRCRCR